MVEIGYALSSEEIAPKDLVHCARRAEEVGFSFGMIADHYHPWIPLQGQASFVWCVIGGIAQATEQLRLYTGVTCPTRRIHPAIIAQAAATAATMMTGRFGLGVGSGENLNEHIVGEHWPEVDVRLEMLEEAIEIIRGLWSGGQYSHRGLHFTVENAQLYTRPDQPPPIYVAASGPKSAELAGRVGDGLVSTSPNREGVEEFSKAGGNGKPRFGQVTVCWAADEAQARKTARERWPIGALHGEAQQELALPLHFEEIAQLVREDDVAQSVVCGPDPGKHLEMIQKYIDAGFDHVFVRQVGPDQEGFFRFYEREILPRLK